MRLFILLFVFGMFEKWIESYPSGAGDESCDSLTPHHGAQAQNSLPPYMIVPLSDRYIPGKPFQVIIRVKDEKSPYFSGFLVQARKSGSGTPVGTWTVKPGARLSQTKSCFANDDSMTHTSKENKTKLILTWNPPNRNLGPITFYFTAVETKIKFWVRISATIQEGVAYPTQRQGSIDFNSWPPAAKGPLWNNFPHQIGAQDRSKTSKFSIKPTIVYDYYDYEDTSPSSSSTVATTQNIGKIVQSLMAVTKVAKTNNESNVITLPSPHQISFNPTTFSPIIGLQTKSPFQQAKALQPLNSNNATEDYYYYYTNEEDQFPQMNNHHYPTANNLNHSPSNARVHPSPNVPRVSNSPITRRH